jgi:cell division protein FtsW
MGLLFVLGIFAFFIFRALKVTLNTRDNFAMLLGIGLISWISYQTLINIAGITRTIPLTGVPLPFLSYGGSALIAVMAGVGILLSVSRYTTQARVARSREAPARRQSSRPPREAKPGPVFERGRA